MISNLFTLIYIFFLIFDLGSHLTYVQGLLLALSSRASPGFELSSLLAWESDGLQKFEPGSAMCKTNTPPTILSYKSQLFFLNLLYLPWSLAFL